MQLRQAEPMDAGTIADFNVRLAEETESMQLDPATVLKMGMVETGYVGMEMELARWEAAAV